VGRKSAVEPSAQVVRVQSIVEEKKAAILKRWRESILQSYPTDSTKFLQGEKNQFANPVGHAINHDTITLLDGILAGTEPAEEGMSLALDNLVKIRAVQDFSPAEALAFIFSLKQILRDELSAGDTGTGSLAVFDERIDRLALAAFECYTEKRERIYEIKVRMIQNRTIKLLERTNLFHEEATQFGISDNGDGDDSSLKGGTGT